MSAPASGAGFRRICLRKGFPAVPRYEALWAEETGRPAPLFFWPANGITSFLGRSSHLKTHFWPSRPSEGMDNAGSVPVFASEPHGLSPHSRSSGTRKPRPSSPRPLRPARKMDRGCPIGKQTPKASRPGARLKNTKKGRGTEVTRPRSTRLLFQRSVLELPRTDPRTDRAAGSQ